jgi:hypothetical protein
VVISVVNGMSKFYNIFTEEHAFAHPRLIRLSFALPTKIAIL